MEEKETTLLLSQIKSLLRLTLSHLKANTSDDSIKKGFDTLIEKIGKARIEEDAFSIKKDYRSLIIQMDSAAVEDKPKKSFMNKLFQKDEKEIKQLEEFSKITENLLTAFSKGTLLILKEDSPLYRSTSSIKAGNYEDYSETQLADYGQKILSFFMGQSLENEVVTKERNELKKIISILASNIQEFGDETKAFDTGLSSYAEKIEKASSLHDIVQAKKEILFETEKIREANKTIDLKLKKAKEKVEISTIRINELENELKKINLEKATDPLTQVYNRQALDNRIETAIKQVKRGKLACVMIFDIDDFKKFNNSYSNQAGDLVLKTIAILTKEIFAEGGFVARYGGEEFSVVLFEKPLSHCSKKANALLTGINTHTFVYKKKDIHITVSIGITMIRGNDSVESAYKRVDDYLCKAKRKGKNRVVGK
tara:strand:- start:3449 stop:4723 length:1275 start_codon:yes stop_codon:yes gene_type:complete